MITPTSFADSVKYFSFKFNILGYIFISNNSLLGYINHVNEIGTEREVCFFVLPMENLNQLSRKRGILHKNDPKILSIRT